MLPRVLRGSLVCALLAAGACMVQETPDDALSADSADGEQTEMAGVVPPPEDVACAVARRDTTVVSVAAGGEITTAYARYIYPAGAYSGGQPIHIRFHPGKNGVHIAPPPAEVSQLWLNYAMCPGDGNPVYYFHIGNDHHPARKLDATWIASVVVRGDMLAPVAEASLLPSLQVGADTSAIRGGFVIVSN